MTFTLGIILKGTKLRGNRKKTPKNCEAISENREVIPENCEVILQYHEVIFQPLYSRDGRLSGNISQLRADS